MTRILYGILISIIIACNTRAQTEIVNLIVYNDFVNPQNTYDSLINDFTESGLVDSIKIIGRPIRINKMEFHIDTFKVKQFDISFEKLDEKIDRLSLLKTIDEISSEHVVNNSGRKIPVQNFTNILIVSDEYKPGIFVPKPESYIYKEVKAVKVKFYCREKSKKELIEFIENKFPKYLDQYIDEEWSWEIVKGEIK